MARDGDRVPGGLRSLVPRYAWAQLSPAPPMRQRFAQALGPSPYPCAGVHKPPGTLSPSLLFRRAGAPSLFCQFLPGYPSPYSHAQPCLHVKRSCGRFECPHGKEFGHFPEKCCRVGTKNAIPGNLAANTATPLSGRLRAGLFLMQIWNYFPENTPSKRIVPELDSPIAKTKGWSA